MPRLVVTGGAGFIGSHLVDALVRRGDQVVVVDNLYTGRRSNVNPQAVFHQVDIRSPEILDLMAAERPDILNHHAAQISVPDSVADPLLDADVNIKGLLNLLEAGRKHGVKKVIFISSGGAIYGEASEYPTSERYLPRPVSPYAVSKYASEHYLTYYRHQYGLDYTTLRYANIYGPRQVPHGEAGVVAIFMNNLLHRRPSTVNHFAGDEAGMIRDYCYVKDVVEANLAALDKGSGDCFNIGTGVGTRTLDLYHLIFEAFLEIVPDIPEAFRTPLRELARPGDLTRSCLIVEKAHRGLGWTPRTDLKDGIRETLRWRLNQV